MNNKLLSYSLLGIGLLTLILVATIVFNPPAKDEINPTLGGTTNFDHLDTTEGYSVDGTEIISGTGEINSQDLVQGGGITTLTTGTSTTMTAANVCDNSYLKWLPTSATVSTTTLPTAASLIADCLTEDGDYKEIIFANIAANAASTTVFTTGTATILLIPDDGGNRVINGMSLARLLFIAASSTHVYLSIEELVPSP